MTKMNWKMAAGCGYTRVYQAKWQAQAAAKNHVCKRDDCPTSVIPTEEAA